MNRKCSLATHTKQFFPCHIKQAPLIHDYLVLAMLRSAWKASVSYLVLEKFIFEIFMQKIHAKYFHFAVQIGFPFHVSNLFDCKNNLTR